MHHVVFKRPCPQNLPMPYSFRKYPAPPSRFVYPGAISIHQDGCVWRRPEKRKERMNEWMREEDAATYYHIGMKLIQKGDKLGHGRGGEGRWVTDLRSIVVVNLHWMMRNWRHIIVDLRQTCSLECVIIRVVMRGFCWWKEIEHFPLKFFFYYMLLNLIITTLEWIMSWELNEWWERFLWM